MIVLCLVLPLNPVAWTQEEIPSLQPPITLLLDRTEIVEAESVPILWRATPDIVQVKLFYRALRTPLRTRARGEQWGIIEDRVSADACRTNWVVPWIDGLRVRVYAKGFDASGTTVAQNEAALRFRPKELAGQVRDGIYVDVSHRMRQRLYRQKNGELVQVAICSGSSTHSLRKSRHCGGRIHDHLGWFRVIQKDIDHVSTLDPTWYMPYALRFHRAHFIHATVRRNYRRLGRPASHGCIRLHHVDGKKLYHQTRIGDWVCVY